MQTCLGLVRKEKMLHEKEEKDTWQKRGSMLILLTTVANRTDLF